MNRNIELIPHRLVQLGILLAICIAFVQTQPTSTVTETLDSGAINEEILNEIRLTRQVCSAKNGETSLECPNDFTFLPGRNKCYRLIPERVNWDVARLRCKDVNRYSHVVVVNDQDEQDAIGDFFFNKNVTLSNFCNHWWFVTWTAGQHIDLSSSSSTFLWKPDSLNWRPMLYTNWNAGEPNGGSGEGCVHFFNTAGYKWNDTTCTSEMCVLCEIDMS